MDIRCLHTKAESKAVYCDRKGNLIHLPYKPKIIKRDIHLRSNEPNTFPGFQQNALEQSLKGKGVGLGRVGNYVQVTRIVDKHINTTAFIFN